jgi:hypothetical protein
MPLTLTLTEGILPKGSEKVAVARLTESFLKWHGLTGNKVMTANIVAHVHILPKGSTYTGAQETPVALVEWRVPSFAFPNRDVQVGHFADATDIVHELSGGRQRRDHIFGSVIYAVDGAWNLDGRAMTNAEIGAAISKG